MSLKTEGVKLGDEGERLCCVKCEPELAPELIQAPDVVCPPAGTSAVTYSVKQESIVERPTDECSDVETDASDQTNHQEHMIIQGLELKPELLKEEKEEEEMEEWLCGVSEAAARAGLYAGHAVKRELVLGPELLQPPDIAFALKGVSVDTSTASPALTSEGDSDEYPGEDPQRREVEMKSCVVRLERIAIETRPLVHHTALEKLDNKSSRIRQAGKAIHERSLQTEVTKHDQEVEVEEEGACIVSETGARAGHRGANTEPRTGSQAPTAKGARGDSPGEGPRCNKSLPVKICSVRLERIPIHKYTRKKPAQRQNVTGLFPNNGTLPQDKQAHSAKKPHKCQVCNKLFSIYIHFKIHSRTHTGGKIYQCDICDKQFAHLSSFVQHKRSHTGEKPYHCDVCHKQFTVSGNLIAHKRIHTGVKQFQCNVCNNKFTTHRYLILHKRIHTGERSYECEICNKKFTDSTSLTIHKRVHTGEKPYMCDMCKKQFTHLSNLKRHKRTHTGEKPFKCDVCNKHFASSSQLVTHKHIHLGKKPYECDVCKKRFTAPNSLIRHQRIHKGEKPYECDICNKQFRSSGNLSAHRRIHTGEKPYTCDICNKKFNGCGNLIRHKRIHTGVKP